MDSDILAIVNPEADRRFRATAKAMSLDPDDPWVGGYADLEWSRSRFFFESHAPTGKAVLEFGCHVGATAIVLAKLGARVTAIDVDARYVHLAEINAERHGVAEQIEFRHVPDTTSLPYAPHAFDMVTVISVLEYVPPAHLEAVQMAIDRVLRPGGLVLVSGTSNRLWPKEIHSGRWLVNYLPRALDVWTSRAGERQRGVSPSRVVRGFGGYANVDVEDGGAGYFKAKRSGRHSAAKMRAFKLVNAILNPAGVSIGLCTPCIHVVLRKGPEALSS